MLQYVTTNEGKVREAREYMDCEQFAYDYTEIQHVDLGAIAAHGAREAYREAGNPVLVDDAGLFVDSLGGFPGPYSSYAEDTLGIERVQRLVAGEEDHRASFRCVLAYCDGADFAASPDPVDRDERALAAADGEHQSDSGVPVKLFEGTVRGRIVSPRGDGGFGYDPIFEHEGTTMAEMSTEEKNAISHRGRALAKFGEWFAER
ncbi:non-canonical purine NTP pyrophosphatase [Halococcus sediminicola]|uniref:non-canonical purine NTP pyrophosphatase n=1 Tax=Halococcus sediminicola TaxID=1264579 RepID=UPI000679CC63|nr:non-canonical purine NTP pyrophosphatase [Halococcus sediminicola]